jgi:uncharacterized membrane protein YdjX (TVP38/TMEM64 family)
LTEQQDFLRIFVARHTVLAPLAFIGIYTTAVACAIPGGIVMGAAAGLLFGTIQGGIYALIAITIGATILFLAARTALRPVVERRFSRLLERITPAVETNGFLYLLAVRLIPLTPFWLVNIAAALGGVRLIPYILATFIGIVPITFVFTSLGEGLSRTLAAGSQLTTAQVLVQPSLLIPLLGLAVLALLPIALKRGLRR